MKDWQRRHWTLWQSFSKTLQTNHTHLKTMMSPLGYLFTYFHFCVSSLRIQLIKVKNFTPAGLSIQQHAVMGETKRLEFMIQPCSIRLVTLGKSLSLFEPHFCLKIQIFRLHPIPMKVNQKGPKHMFVSLGRHGEH